VCTNIPPRSSAMESKAYQSDAEKWDEELDIPEGLDLDDEAVEWAGGSEPNSPPSDPEECRAIIAQWLGEFEGLTPEPTEEVFSRFFGFKEHDTAGWYEKRAQRRARADELRRHSYYRACRDMKWFVEHNEEELEKLVRETWASGLSQEEAIFSDTAYVEAKEYLSRKSGGAE
jgi:hypothetical protein